MINAVPIGRLRSPAQPSTLSKAGQPELRNTDADVKDSLARDEQRSSHGPSEPASRALPEVTKVSADQLAVPNIEAG
jgi:hypothetical protein